MKSISARILLLVLSITLALIVTACGSTDTPNWDNMPPGTYAPHPVFEEFYLENGGHELFGYPVSTVFTNQSGKRFQYFETVLMSYDPLTDRISFEPLGLELGLDALPVMIWQGEGRDGDDGLLIGEFRITPGICAALSLPGTRPGRLTDL